ncbi:MAG: SIS domain-containing protein [SAR202 cluster bacterium]|nr:SIS domain-containing protein [SAR202 cluster bacterium]
MTTQPRNGHPYHMHDAIVRQPAKVGVLLSDPNGQVKEAAEQTLSRERIHLVGIGTSWHAALIGEFWMRNAGGWHNRVQAWNSFEFAHYTPPLGPSDAVIIITHSGAKGSSLQALDIAKKRGAFTVCMSSTQAEPTVEAADLVLRTCEREKSSAFTISYTSALAVLALLSVELGRASDKKEASSLKAELDAIPEAMQAALGLEPEIKRLAHRYAGSSRFYFAGWGGNAATAYEVALKMKEASYTITEGFQLEQLLHGPFLSSDPKTLLTLIAPPGPGRQRAAEIAQAFSTIGAPVLALSAEGDETLSKLASDRLSMPPTPDLWSPLTYIVPLQMFTYYVALAKGKNPDVFRRDDPLYAEARRRISL